jgi:hypothetical protein
MAKTRYVVAPGMELNYPANEISQKILKNAGGRSKLSEQDLATIKFRRVKEGEDPSDMPDKEVFNLYLERGYIIDTNPEVEEIVPEKTVVEGHK